MDKNMLGIVSCSKEKIWDIKPDIGAVSAQYAYRSAFFELAKRYVQLRCKKWLILSAKYGLMTPEFQIPQTYDLSFNRAEDSCIPMEKLRNQAKKYHSSPTVLVLCPSLYGAKLEEAFAGSDVEIRHPLRGVGGFGAMHSWLRAENDAFKDH